MDSYTLGCYFQVEVSNALTREKRSRRPRSEDAEEHHVAMSGRRAMPLRITLRG